MKSRIQLWLRRWAIRSLIKLVDRAEDRLQAWQVLLRNDLSDLRDRQHPPRTVHSSEDLLHQRTGEYRPESETDLAAGCNFQASPRQRAGGMPLSTRETFLQWEARKSGVAPIETKRHRFHLRRQRAADFDARFEAPSPKPKEYLQ
jgi:hypothetical protein